MLLLVVGRDGVEVGAGWGVVSGCKRGVAGAEVAPEIGRMMVVSTFSLAGVHTGLCQEASWSERHRFFSFFSFCFISQ